MDEHLRVDGPLRDTQALSMTLTPMLQWDKITANQMKRGCVEGSEGGASASIVQGADGDYYLHNQRTVSLNHPPNTPLTHSLMDGAGRHATAHSNTSSTHSNPRFNDLISTVMITTVAVDENCNSCTLTNRNENLDATYDPCNIRKSEKKQTRLNITSLSSSLN